MPSNLTDLAAALIRAAEVIERNGLHKGAFVAPAGVPDRLGVYHVDDLSLRPVDMVGAIRIAYGASPEDLGCMPANHAVQFVSEKSEPLDGQSPVEFGEPNYVEDLAGWNDKPERTALEVAARLRRIAVEAEIAAEKASRVKVRVLAAELGVTINEVHRRLIPLLRAVEDKRSVVAVPAFNKGDCVLTAQGAEQVRASLTAVA